MSQQADDALAGVDLGVDGGKSELRARVCGTPRTVVVTAATHGGDIAQRVRRSVSQAWRDLGSPPVRSVAAGLTAVPADPEALHRLADAIAADLGARQVVLVSDIVSAHADAFSGGPGAVLSVGTGVAALALDPAAGRDHQVSGGGSLIGDEGGAFWIGRRALASALAAADGRGHATELLAAAEDWFGVPAADLAVHVHTRDEPVADVAGFAPRVLELAAAGDGVASQIALDAVEELVSCVRACAEALPTAVAAGVAVAGRAAEPGALLRVRLDDALRRLHPPVAVHPGTASSLDGACRLAAGLSGYDRLVLARSTAVTRAPATVRPTQSPALTAPELPALRHYLEAVQRLLGEAAAQEVGRLEDLARQIAQRLAKGGMLHTFGTGHSHLLAEEIFYRAGGLARVDPLLRDDLMLHRSAAASTQREREPGLARELLATHPIAEPDVLVVASNSGGGQVAVEVAQLARARGVLVVGVTSLRHATSPNVRRVTGPRLHEVVDVVLDNHGNEGDAAAEVAGLDRRVGPTSTVVGAALLQALVVGVVEELIRLGLDPEVFASSNTEGGDDVNAVLVERYRGRIAAL